MNVVIPASGVNYQIAAAWSASTYSIFLKEYCKIYVIVPKFEKIIKQLKDHKVKYGFEIEKFSFSKEQNYYGPTQLKCVALEFAVKLFGDSPILFCDADTFCRSFFRFDAIILEQISKGNIGMVEDVVNRHPSDDNLPWYVPNGIYSPYVNSGVILADNTSLDMVSLFCEYSFSKEFSCPPFQDQSIINYLISTKFKKRLIILDNIYNSLRKTYDPDCTIIGHLPGGAGKLGKKNDGRALDHIKQCQITIEKARHY